ncbi:MAG: MBL fold metallo-hydrolase [Gemmatimonadales bacterium]
MKPRRHLLAVALCVAAVPRVAPAQSPRDVIARVVAAMGGEAALRGINAVTSEYQGATFALGQEETPASPARATLVFGRATADYRGQRRLTAFEQRAVSGTVSRLRRVLAGGISMLDNNGRLTPDGPLVTAGEATVLRRGADRLLLAALDNPGALTTLAPKRWRGERHPGVRVALGPDTLDLYFDPRSALLTVSEALSDDPILGDRRTVTWFTRWQASGGMMFARQVDVEVNGRLNSHTVITAVTVNPDTPDSLFVIPDSIAGQVLRTAPPITVTLAELAPGVWRAEGGSHHSLVVDQGTRLVVVEAPQSTRRIQAVLDTLRSRFPGRPVGAVVNTHHHWDHAGGMRGALAAGRRVVTHARNAAFVRGIAAAPKTVSPDSLSRRPRAPSLTLVDDTLTLGEGDSRVVVYRLPTAHVEGMLAAYLPAARLLFTSDVLSPGPTMSATGAAEVVAFARARALSIERVAGGHGGVANWVDVEKAATP